MDYGYVDSFYVSSEFPHGENYKKIYPMQTIHDEISPKYFENISKQMIQLELQDNKLD